MNELNLNTKNIFTNFSDVVKVKDLQKNVRYWKKFSL